MPKLVSFPHQYLKRIEIIQQQKTTITKKLEAHKSKISNSNKAEIEDNDISAPTTEIGDTPVKKVALTAAQKKEEARQLK